MGKTADLTVVQKTIIDTLHKEGKPQTFIAKEAGISSRIWHMSTLPKAQKVGLMTKVLVCLTGQQTQKLITSMPRRIEAVIKAKVAPIKYWVHIQ